jgi:predicted NBD/HSP70 family sugar kinase
MATVRFTTSGVLRKSALREANERLILDSIRRVPGISRAEIARTTGFSRTSVTFVVNRLIRDRFVREEKLEPTLSAGRPPTALQLASRARLAIGVEVTPGKSRAVLVDLTGEGLAEREIPWDADPRTFLDGLRQAILGVAAGHGTGQILGVGISLPGTIEKSTGRVIGAEGLGWFDVPAGATLRRGMPWPLFFENDANLAALAEQWYLPAGREALRYFVYVQASGGLGTGVVVDGRILHGAASASAEFGHVMLDPNGYSCRCGNRGCWEQYASDGALLRNYNRHARGGAELEDAMEVVRLARGGDRTALEALRYTASYLALGFVNLVAVLNPQAIVIGEPYSSAWDLIEDIVQDELRRRVPAYNLNNLRLLPSREGANATLRGAAALVLAGFFTSFDHAKDDGLPNGVSIEVGA